MLNQLLLPLIALIGITIWLAVLHAVRTEQVRRQREVASRGEFCQGRIVAVQRPFLLDSCTRLYFEFAPPGAQEPLRCCHVDRRSHEELAASLPATGATVTVKYLPDRPQRAVIGKLVSNLS